MHRPSDIIFEATMKKEIGKETPTTGDVVTFMFKYYSSSGAPNQAEILRVRRDLLWRDVCLTQVHFPAFNSISSFPSFWVALGDC